MRDVETTAPRGVDLALERRGLVVALRVDVVLRALEVAVDAVLRPVMPAPITATSTETPAASAG
jgi:hypothetical protein